MTMNTAQIDSKQRSTRNRTLIRDISGNVVATDTVRIIENTLKYADTYLGIAIEPVEIGESNGDALYGLMSSIDNGRTPTAAEQAAIGAFVNCSDENDECRARMRIEAKIDALACKLDAVLVALVGTEGAKAVAGKNAARKATDVFAEGDKHHLPVKPARKTAKKA